MTHLTVLDHLSAPSVAAVLRLVEAATEADGVPPLSEHVMLHLRHGGDAPARHLLLHAADGLTGYAHLDTTDAVEGPSGELVVDPAQRRHGHARALVLALLAETDGRLRLWAHGEGAGAVALARSLGFTRARSLWQLRRSLFSRLPAPDWPPGVTVRTFRPGQDEPAWLALNARAFAQHPEQGRWTAEDLRRRIAEPWFDPAGFFLAEREGGLVGFHWTKVHGGHAHGGHAHEALGEVYVVAVDPAEQGSGLGRALTLEGLRFLRGLGLGQVMLYVDADNLAAIRVYERLGFSRWDTDTVFRSPDRRRH